MAAPVERDACLCRFNPSRSTSVHSPAPAAVLPPTCSTIRQPADQRLQAQPVAVPAKPGDLAQADRGDDRLVPERLAGGGIAEMHLDHRRPALGAGIAGGADVILIPEIPYDIDAVCDKIMDREARGRRFSIVVAAEGARPRGGDMVARDQGAGREKLLGGIAERIAGEIQERTGKETRSVVLGHLQRGGRPTTFDRLLALRFGAAAVRTVSEGRFGVMVALDPPTVLAVPLEEATKRMKSVPLDCDTVLTARDLGVSFGDGSG